MTKGKKLEKLILDTIISGSITVCHSAYAEMADDLELSNRGEATPITYEFAGKPFMNANFYTDGFIVIKADPEQIEDTDEGKITLRPFVEGESTSISNGIKYWYNVLGTPATVPNVDIYLCDIKDSNAGANSDNVGNITKLAKCFQEKFDNDPQSCDAYMMLNLPMDNQKFYTERLTILPVNGADVNYPSTITHEMFHALGVSSKINASFEEGEKVMDIPSEISFNLYEQHLYDFKGHKLSECNKLALIESPDEADNDKTFYFIKKSSATQDNEGFNGVYFKGKHVDAVLNLNGQIAKIAWPNDHELEPVAGIPINGIENTSNSLNDIEMSHFELQNSLQSHQSYRNLGVPMEVELAALEDLGYTIDRRKLYGNSVYNSDIEYVNNNPFYERENGVYIEGKPSAQCLAIGLHIYGSNNKILQKSNLLADGEESMGIRVDGVNNTITIDKDSKVTANGLNGRGINFAYGKDHKLNVEGIVTALGTGGNALAFDFGDNFLRNVEDYRGSYIRVKVYSGEYLSDEYLSDEYVDEDDPKVSALAGALVKEVNISGTVAGNNAAIYIAPNAYVQNINIKTGADLQGDIISDWSPKGGVVGPLGKDVSGNDIILSEDNIHLPDGDDGLTRLNFEGDKLDYAGDILTGTHSIVMNVKSGTLNYTGAKAQVDSVNVAKGAILQGGTYELNENGSNTLTNEGMISAALPKDADTVMTINGNVVNAGGSMAFIANCDYVGTIKINGNLCGDKILAINPNGIYLPGDTYDISDLVSVNGKNIEFDSTISYKQGLLEAVYSNGNKQISFAMDKNVAPELAAAAEEMGNLGRALGAQKNEAAKIQVAALFSEDSAKTLGKTLKAIKGEQAANTSVVMQQSSIIHNALGMRLSQVNRAKSAKVNVPVKQLAKGAPVVVPMDIIVQPDYSMWAKVSHNKGAVNTESDYKTDAYSIGWDKQVSKDWRFGFLGSYAKGKFEADTIRNDIEDYRLGVYGGYNKGAAEALVYADYGWGKNKLNRGLSSGLGTTKAKYDSNIMEIVAEYKYDLQHDNNKTWHVAPYGNLQVNRYSQKAYKETGADPFNQNVDKLNNTYVGLEAGVDLERRFANGSAYGMRVGYRRGLTGVEPKQNYHYAADPAHRYTNHGEADKNKLVLSLNGEVQTAPNWSISAEAGYERGKKGHGYSGEISLKYSW